MDLIIVTAFVLPVVLMFPVSVKWQIRFWIALPWSLLMGVVSALFVKLFLVHMPGLHPVVDVVFSILIALIFTAVVLLCCFFRDPERTPPTDQKCIISPADGEVIYIKIIDKGEFPFSVKKGTVIPLADFIKDGSFMESGIQIGIAMNFLNVHVNRTPIDGTIEVIRRIPGEFRSLKHISSLLENERVCSLVRGSDISVCVVQIASRLVRRITSSFREGDRCDRGQRMGMIKFGSQVDLLVPASQNLKVLVKVGQHVKAGESIIARY